MQLEHTCTENSTTCNCKLCSTSNVNLVPRPSTPPVITCCK